MKSREIVVTLSGHTALLLWQACSTFASLPGLAPAARARCHTLASQWYLIGRGDIGNGAALADADDALCVAVLDAHEPGRALLRYVVNWHTWRGGLLDDGRPNEIVSLTPWGLLENCQHTGRHIPAGLVSWLREASAGDSAQFNNQEMGLRCYAEVRAADNPTID